MGLGQKFLTRVGLGQVSHLWFGFGKFPLKITNFSIFGSKKTSSSWVKKYPDPRPLIYCGSKVCSGWVGSGSISTCCVTSFFLLKEKLVPLSALNCMCHSKNLVFLNQNCTCYWQVSWWTWKPHGFHDCKSFGIQNINCWGFSPKDQAASKIRKNQLLEHKFIKFYHLTEVSSSWDFFRVAIHVTTVWRFRGKPLWVSTKAWFFKQKGQQIKSCGQQWWW